NGTDGSVIPSSEVTKINDRAVIAQARMDALVEKRVNNGKGTVDVKTGLRWGGWISKTPLENAVEYFRYDFESGMKPDVVDAMIYGSTDIDEIAHERIVTD
uniref:Uncharacterized protein n=2 Tax=Clytia hemisphaerica TaxID=252671 RepID=A0A7M5X5A8_9CNID